MKKIIKTILLDISILFIITGCKSKNLNIYDGTDVLKEHGEIIFTIYFVKKDCVPVLLSVYNNDNYELFTAYKTFNTKEPKNMKLEYSKSIKGTYNFDVKKIIEESVDADGITYSMNNLPKYEIYTGDGHHYIIKKHQKNESLTHFLSKINVDLDLCAIPDYS